MTLLPNSIFNWIMRGFHRAFAMGLACRHTLDAHSSGHLVPSNFGTCICFTCWDQSLSQTCRIFTWLYTLWTSLGTFSTFLSNLRCKLLVMTGGSPVMIKGQGRLLALLVKPFVGTMQASFWPIYNLKVISKPKKLTDERTDIQVDRQTDDRQSDP